LIIIYSVVNLNISKGLSFMDTRLLVIAGPLLIAASWALINIGRLAIQQLQRMK
jgi:Photosystem II protein Y (PsbY)